MNCAGKLPILTLFGNYMIRYGLGTSYLQRLAISRFNALSHHIAASLPLPLIEAHSTNLNLAYYINLSRVQFTANPLNPFPVCTIRQPLGGNWVS
jgi:hypothetical protein